MSKHYTLKFRAINRATFLAIKDGSKKVETRAATTKYSGIKAGDTLTFSCGKTTFDRTIKKVKHYASIFSLLRDYKPYEVDPAAKTKAELTAMYHSFPGYEKKIAEHGLVAFTLE